VPIEKSFVLYMCRTDRGDRSVVVTNHSHSYCHMRHRKTTLFLFNLKMILKRVKNMLRQPKLFISIITVSNLVTLSL
jgi:hypothetical protein